jgi:tetratricopeptide (TPR) repeat protein
LAFCKIEPTSLFGVSNTLLYLGKQYDKIGEKHLARSYYEQAIAALPDTNNLVYRDITAIKALCEYQLGAGIECPLTTLYQILALADTEVERLTRFLTIGRIFYEENLYDSALFYIEPVFESDYRLTSRIQAADCLRNIYQNKGDKEKMNEYARFLADHRKPESQNKALVSQLDTMFQDYLGQKQERKIVQKRKDTIRKVVWTMVFVIGLFFVGIVLMKCRNKRHLETLRRSHRMEQAALSGRLKQSNQELRELKDQIKRQGDNEIASTEVQATTFLKEPICCLVLERVNEGQFLSQMDCTIYRNYALDKNQLAALRNAADRHFNQFTMRISNAHPELTRTDLDYCCLYLLGLSDADVAALMQRAYNTVNERNSKLRRVFGSKNSISVTLQSIANESAID